MATTRVTITTISDDQEVPWPDGIDTCAIESRASGGHGEDGDSGTTGSDFGGGGGGCGAYSRVDTLTKGAESSLFASLRGPGAAAGDDGGDAYVKQSGTIICKAAGGKAGSSRQGGAGGKASDGVGDFKVDGGHGSDSPDSGDGGAGGSSGGPPGDGFLGNSEFTTIPLHRAPPQREAPRVRLGPGGKGGDGGQVGVDSGNGSEGDAPSGGGGGGAKGGGAGAIGRRGEIIFTFPAPVPGHRCCCGKCFCDGACKISAVKLTISGCVDDDDPTPPTSGSIRHSRMSNLNADYETSALDIPGCGDGSATITLGTPDDYGDPGILTYSIDNRFNAALSGDPDYEICRLYEEYVYEIDVSFECIPCDGGGFTVKCNILFSVSQWLADPACGDPLAFQGTGIGLTQSGTALGNDAFPVGALTEDCCTEVTEGSPPVECYECDPDPCSLSATIPGCGQPVYCGHLDTTDTTATCNIVVSFTEG